MEKKDGFLSIVKGFITGISSLVPGISSASVFLSLNIYDNVLDSLNQKRSTSLKLVTIPFFIGLIIAVFSSFSLTNFFYTKYQLQTLILFIGLIVGGSKMICLNKKIMLTKKNILLFMISLIIFSVFFYFLNSINIFCFKNEIINTLILGMISGFSVLIPPLSIAKIHSKNSIIINSIANLSSFTNIIIILMFFIVSLVVFIIFSKIVYKLIKKYEEKIYIVLISLMISSIFLSFLEITKINISFTVIFTSLLSFLWGYILAKNIIHE